MTTAIMAPWAKDEVTRLGQRTFKKEILRFGHVKTDDGEFDFTPEFGAQMVEAFQSGVIDEVPLQLADAFNTHTQEVDRKRVGGEIIGLELSNDGLTGIIRANTDTAALIDEHPRMGVSIRALQGRLDNNGKRWPAVLHHVLATFDPVVTGMKPWEPIELANDVTRVIDLANPAGRQKEAQMADTKIGNLSPEQAEQLYGLLGTMLGKDEVKSEDPTDTPDGGEVVDPEKGGDAPGTVEDPSGTGTGDDAKEKDGVPLDLDLSTLTDEELEALLLTDDDEGEDATDEVASENPAPTRGTIDVGNGKSVDVEGRELEPIAASNEGTPAVELANAQGAEMAIELSRMRNELDTSRYEQERTQLARESGLSPRIIDLARDVLQGSGHVIELSRPDGKKTVDAGSIVRSLITEIGKTYKALDLSHPAGYALETEEDKSEAAERAEFLERAKKQFRL